MVVVLMVVVESGGIQFHPIEYPTWVEAYGDPGKMACPPGFWNAVRAFHELSGLVW